MESSSRVNIRQDTLWQRFVNWWENRESDVNVRLWVGVGAGLVVLGALLRTPVLALLGVLIAIVGLALRLWWDYAFANLSLTRSFDKTRAFWGDRVEFEYTAENAKPIPVSRLDITDELSHYAEVEGHSLGRSANSRNRLFQTMFTLGMYERVTHRFTLVCNRRGWYRFGPTELIARDPFGMVTRRSTWQEPQGVLVYPRMVPMTEFVVPARQPLGDMKPSTPLVEDPMRMSGVRPYVAGDSPKRIHWRASARTGELQTRVFEPSATPVAAIFLDTITFSHLWEGQNSNLLELSVILTASMSRQLIDGRHQVGVYANAPIPDVARTIRVSPGRTRGQLTTILENLAMMQPAFGDRIEKMLSQELRKLPWGASIVVITSQVTADLQRTLLRLARTGGAQRFVIITLGDVPNLVPEVRRRFAVYHYATEEAWDVIERISLTRLA